MCVSRDDVQAFYFQFILGIYLRCIILLFLDAVNGN
jgi:hypothetical protein